MNPSDPIIICSTYAHPTYKQLVGRTKRTNFMENITIPQAKVESLNISPTETPRKPKSLQRWAFIQLPKWSGSLQIISETTTGLICRTGTEEDSPATEYFPFSAVGSTFNKVV